MKATQSNPFTARQSFASAIFLATGLLVSSLHAATIDKADNAFDLNLPTSWTGAVVPGAFDIAQWTGLAGANSTLLGGNLSLQGITIGSTGGAVTIQNGNTLTLGSSGINMSGANQNLTISSNLTLAQGAQTWNVPTGQALTLDTGTFSRSAGATLNLQGSGTFTTSMSGLANVNSIVGPWATVGSGISTSYATLTGGNIVEYTGADALSGLVNVFGGMPSGGTGTVNYDVSGTGTFPVFGLVRNINTLRYTGGGATQQSNTTADLLTVNGILNAGTGALNIGGGSFALRVTIGASNNLVLNAESAAINLANEVKNGASPGSVTIQGSGGNSVTLAGPNTYTGGTFVSSGRLFAGSTAMNGGPIHISQAGTLTFTGNNLTSTSTVTGSGAILNDSANTIVFTGNHSGFTGTFTHSADTANTQFNTGVSGSANAAYSISGGELIFAGAGNYTVPFGSLARSGGAIRGANAATGTTTLEVGNLNTDSSITGNLNNGGAKVLALTKVGTGTLTLGGTNTYSGTTTILNGTLRIEDAISATNTIDNQANLVFAPSGTYTFPNSITGAGNLTLDNGGTLNLTGNNNFTGNTFFDEGELFLRGSFGAISVANNSLNVIGPATGLAFTAASLSFAGAAEISLPLTASPGDPAPITVTGALTTTPANGDVTIDIAPGVVSNGTYNLVNFGSLAGNLADFELVAPSLNSRQSATLFVSGGSTLAMLVDGDAPKWTGLDSGSWTDGFTGPSSNWRLITGGTATNFQSNDDALFDDSATTGTTAVNIDISDVYPRATVFNHSVLNYTVSGDFGIATGSVTKSGTAALTLASNNQFDQGLAFEGGTLNINSATAIGTGTFSINPGSAKVIDNTSGSAVANTNPNPLSWVDNFTSTGSNDLDLGTGTVTASGDDASRTLTVSAGTLTLGELKAPAHGLIKAGAGTLVLSSTGVGIDGSVLAGPIDIAAGTLQINRSGTDASGDLTATGLSGSGTISNGADVARALILQSTVDATFSGNLTDGGTGGLVLNKRGSSTLTLDVANTYTGGTEIGFNANLTRIGVLRATATGALGTGTVSIGIGGNDATARLELDGGITLPNELILPVRTSGTPSIQSISGVNTLSGNVLIPVGGSGLTIQSDAGTLNLTGTTFDVAATAGTRTLFFTGAGDGSVSWPISNGAALLVSVTKAGDGTWTLTGLNTYTGDTTVNQGIMAVANPVLADAAAVRIAAIGTLHLSHATTDTVSRLFIDGVEQFIGTWGSLASSATYKTARITGTGILNVTNGTTPPSGYGTWATATGLTLGVNDASTFDADSDGSDNGTEYILGGLPLSGANNPKVYSLLADSSADVETDNKELITTIAVPVGTPVFSAGSPVSTATFQGYGITVRGSTDLASFPVTVTPVDPITTGLLAAPVQGGITYEYRSFSLSGSNGLSGKGFLQVSVTHP
ncbi:MAG: autotransporter-associated beta strand repeat-containing protein [Akkermansiaceae bacterium]